MVTFDREAFQELNPDKKKEVLEEQERKRNISLNFIKDKIKSTGNPLNHIGIMTMNKKIPYKKPIIKQNPMTVNAKEVIKEIE